MLNKHMERMKIIKNVVRETACVKKIKFVLVFMGAL